jgi:hypothetical protein
MEEAEFDVTKSKLAIVDFGVGRGQRERMQQPEKERK